MTGTAKKICDIPDFMGQTSLFWVSSPVPHYPDSSPTQYVLVSEVWHEQPGTIVLPARPDGSLYSWIELPGTVYGKQDTVGALAELGFKLENP